jgi:hypothetical protein
VTCSRWKPPSVIQYGGGRKGDGNGDEEGARARGDLGEDAPLTGEVVDTLQEGLALIEAWRRHDNRSRPHSALS